MNAVGRIQMSRTAARREQELTCCLVTADSDPEHVAAVAGGKGLRLYDLTRDGVCVPPWVILPSTLCHHFLRSSGTLETIIAALRDVGVSTAVDVAARIEAIITAAPVVDEVARVIEAAYARLGAGRVAVRSSAAGEDGARFSFAGQYASFLNVAGLSDVTLQVKRCWASAYSARCLVYRLTNHLPVGIDPMACILQTMVDAVKSGVVFTANAVANNPDELLISAVYGLGEGLVSGAVDADVYLLDRHSGAIKETHVGEKLSSYSSATTGRGCMVVPTARTLAEKECLDPTEIAGLHRLARRIEATFGGPQDIEWSIDQAGRVNILQSRPITTGPTSIRATGEASIWENSNIIESFGDMTSPMTFGFARDAYHQVFKEYCRLLGVPRRVLDSMNDWLHDMLGYHNGRVYYNLLNWYKVLRLAPTYKISWKMLEFSIGVQETVDEATKRGLEPLQGVPPLMRRAIYARIAGRSFWYFFTIERLVGRFLGDFYRLHGASDAIDFRARSGQEIYGIFRNLRHKFIAQFGRMIILEQMISLTVGCLGLLTKRWLPDAPADFFLEMTRPEEDLESLEPVHRMMALAGCVAESPELMRLVQDTRAEDLYAALASSTVASAGTFRTQVDAYIDRFGYRCVNEMKLEEPDLREDPSIFFSMLKNVLSQGRFIPEKRTRAGGETYLRAHLSWPQRLIYLAIRDKARRLLALRERVRFCRTRVFGTARRMIKAIGARLARADIIADRQDIFFLRLEELTGWFDGIVAPQEFRPLVELRRRLAGEYAELDAPGRFTTRGAIGPRDYARYGWLRIDSAQAITRPAAVGDGLKGVPCCPGLVTGEAQLVTAPRDVGGRILVTYRTDPGWCPVLPSASALLIERGSPLTHVAIVARELGIPTVIQIKDLTKIVSTGMTLEVDGTRGTVRFVIP